MTAEKRRIGIRREDKSQWERRVPLIPEDVAALQEEFGFEFVVQPSPIRIFPDAAYREAGVMVEEDLSSCPVIFALKEVPVELILPEKTYMFFSHTIKGQSYNMPMLRAMMERKCQLIDYERVVDEHNRRLIFFGQHAGMAGMTDTLWSFGQRLKIDGIASPFERMKPAHAYPSIAGIKRAVAEIGEEIAGQGLPESIAPLVIGFAGYGNVSQGAQSIIDSLPLVEITPADLARHGAAALTDSRKVYKVVFKEEDMVAPRAAGERFELQDYYDHPDKYVSRFNDYTPQLSVLVNCIYWTPRYPRLVTRSFLRELFSSGQTPRLRVIGDISCDVEGSIEATVKATLPDNPVYVYDPETGEARDGFAGRGPVIMAVDILPSELPLDASQEFSAVLRSFVPGIAAADYSGDFSSCDLPAPIKRATILYHGELTPDYQFMSEFI
jgi:saccharopine dehydrogenase (NAD+, L-lysine-forming)